MLKSNRGVTLISLVVTIVVLIILASITTYSGIGTIKDAKYYRAVSELKIMQTKVNEYYEDLKNGDDSVLLYESGALNGEASKAWIAVKNDENVTEDIGSYADYKYWSSEYIKNTLDIDGIRHDFIVNIRTRTVILVNGIEKDDNKYYALCQIEGEQYNVEYDG